MHTLGAEFYLELHSLLARREVLGSSIRVDHHPIRYRIYLPKAPDSFEFDRVGPTRVVGATVADPRDYDPTVAFIDHSSSLVDIRLIRIVANVDSAFTISSYVRNDPASEKEVGRIFRELFGGALELARQFCMATSVVLDQYWIEPSGEYPRVVNAAGLVDITAARSFGFRIAPAGVLHIVAEEAPLQLNSLQTVQEVLRNAPDSLQADEIMLGEARHLINSIPRPVVAPDRSTLLAAIALELRIKRVSHLFTATHGGVRHESYTHDRFLSLVRRNLTANDLLSARAIAARVQSVFQARHQIIHQGLSIEDDVAKQHVATAREAFTLLQQLEADRKTLLATLLLAIKAYSGNRK